VDSAFSIRHHSKIVYLTAITRPDIAYAVSMLSRFLHGGHATLHYLSRTANYG
jgi:hypothetical protein